MKDVICSFCGKTFKKKDSQIELCLKHYCSLTCAEQGRKKGKFVKCSTCSKEVYKTLGNLIRSKTNKYFCCRTCSNRWTCKEKMGEGSPNWVSGESSYKKILSRVTTKPECLKCGKTDVRILCVHHLDKNRKNNKLQNLAWLCRNCHFLVHNYNLKIK